MLRVSDLTKRYKTGDQALRGVSFDVPAGPVGLAASSNDAPVQPVRFFVS